MAAPQIEEQKIQRVADVLREVPGVQVTQSGSPGSVTDVSIRGASPAQTLVLVDGVEVNTGDAWHQANLIGEPSRQAWQRWELVTRINCSGPAVLRARAMDCAGRVQPEHAEWNRLGYGNNSIQEVAIRVV